VATTAESASTVLLEDYKLKVAFATAQIDRMQTQFQVMLTLETALATALIVSNTGSLTRGAKWIVVLEIALSLAWLMVGKSGRSRAVAHRIDLEDAGEAWACAAGLRNYRPVGAGPRVNTVAVAAPVALTVGWTLLLVVLLLYG
jgi:hypothetical protein